MVLVPVTAGISNLRSAGASTVADSIDRAKIGARLVVLNADVVKYQECRYSRYCF